MIHCHPFANKPYIRHHHKKKEKSNGYAPHYSRSFLSDFPLILELVVTLIHPGRYSGVVCPNDIHLQCIQSLRQSVINPIDNLIELTGKQRGKESHVILGAGL